MFSIPNGCPRGKNTNNGGGCGNIKGEDNKRNHYSITIENTYIVSTMCRLLFTALDFH